MMCSASRMVMRECRRGGMLLLIGAVACSPPEWPAYRYGASRAGNQPNSSGLSDPAKVPSLALRWSWHVPLAARAFYASPVVYRDRVYIGNGNGYFYALDASTGRVVWQYPGGTAPALTSHYESNPSSAGIASSATIATINGRDAVI